MYFLTKQTRFSKRQLGKFYSTSKQEVWGFGNNENGQLGLGSRGVIYEPVKIIEGDISHIAVGDEHSLLAMKDGTLLTTGSSKFFQTGQFEQTFTFSPLEDLKFKAKKVSAGKVHSLVLVKKTNSIDTEGKIYSFGNGAKGQLGYDVSRERLKPKQINMEGIPDVIFKDIASGTHASFAITDDDKLYGWGCDFFYQLGLGGGINTITPSLILGGLENKKVLKAVGGMLHSVALTSDGEIYIWGSNKNGAIGLNNIKLAPIPTLLDVSFLLRDNDKVIDIATGWQHSLALTERGDIISWGDNSVGQLGINRELIVKSIPVKVRRENEKVNKGKVIGCGNHFSFYSNDRNEIYSFGSGTEHQLGLGVFFDKNSNESQQQEINEKILKSMREEYLLNGTILYSPQILHPWNDILKSRPNERIEIKQIVGGNRHTLILVDVSSTRS